MTINAATLDYQTLNREIRNAGTDVTITGCLGQRFIAAGMTDRTIAIHGIPGNALGAYLDGASIEVFANAQDAVGDTMNSGTILVHGSIGDAAGYAMRGGRIYIQKDAGYRAGIHMKEYQNKIPVMVIGGTAGSFLGEYQAGGVIIVLGIGSQNRPLIGSFPCTGMHGGKVIVRGSTAGISFPKNVRAEEASPSVMEFLRQELAGYCRVFGFHEKEILDSPFTVITPDSSNPYKQMYVAN